MSSSFYIGSGYYHRSRFYFMLRFRGSVKSAVSHNQTAQSQAYTFHTIAQSSVARAPCNIAKSYRDWWFDFFAGTRPFLRHQRLLVRANCLS